MQLKDLLAQLITFVPSWVIVR